jgi:tetratricopeptide (TPR) repeat protein
MLLELNVIKNIKLKNWKLANRSLQEMLNIDNKNNQIPYYQGLIAYAQQDYDRAAKSFETYLSNQKTQTIFDPMELAAMINQYSDSLYQKGHLDKFQNVTKAILADTKNYAPKNPFMRSLRERLEYLDIEITAGKGDSKSMLLLEPKIKEFLKEYKQTDYAGRCNYLLGMALAKNSKPKEAREVFEKILQDEGTPASIKELVRSELSLMAIKERTI